jgi:hypothetical protein
MNCTYNFQAQPVIGNGLKHANKWFANGMLGVSITRPHPCTHQVVQLGQPRQLLRLCCFPCEHLRVQLRQRHQHSLDALCGCFGARSQG